MKVYVLFYHNWDESEIRGVYTEEGMNKEKTVFAKYGKEYVERITADLEERMNAAYDDAKVHFKVADSSFKEGTKEAKSFGKMENKQGFKLKANAEAIQRELKKYSNFDDNNFCDYYMNKEHLSFEEYYVLD